jgi:protein-S-isoprenylcysteine O-methyltransferase Ste14
MRALATIAILPVGASVGFALFWPWFSWWRRHQGLFYGLMVGMLMAVGTTVVAFREDVFGVQVEMPWPVVAVGWAIIAAATVFGTIADRQIGIHVRAFVPFFEDHGKIELVTTGAYAVVRHPIYAGGIAFQLGVALATGYAAVAVAFAVFAASAVWFTREEERRLVALLRDPEAYARYKARVPALFPLPR